MPNRLVYSPHDYPASVFNQPWLAQPDYPSNLPAVWDAHWGYLMKEDIAPVMVGEFGTRLDSTAGRAVAGRADQLHGQRRFSGAHWLYWSWNPNSGDTGGLLLDDWISVDLRKHNKLATIQFATAGVNTDKPAGTCQAAYSVTKEWVGGFAADVAIINRTGGTLNGWRVTWSFKRQPGHHQPLERGAGEGARGAPR